MTQHLLLVSRQLQQYIEIIYNNSKSKLATNMQQCDKFRKSNGIGTYMCQPISTGDSKDRRIFNSNPSLWEPSPGTKCDVDGQKTCNSATIFENRKPLSSKFHLCLSWIKGFGFIIVEHHHASWTGICYCQNEVSKCPSQTKNILASKPGPNLFWGTFLSNGEDIFVRI